MSDKPGPCPFCGRASWEGSVDCQNQGSRAFKCEGCGATGPVVEVQGWDNEGYRSAEAEATRRWNERVSLVSHDARSPVAFGLRGTCRPCGAKAVVISVMRDDGTAQTRCEACGHTVEFEPGEL